MMETETLFLDISKLLSGEVREIPFDLALAPLSFEKDRIDVSDLRFSGRAFDLSGFPRLSGAVTGVFNSLCARCLAPVNESFSLEIDLPIETGSEETEEETILAHGQKIDLGSFSLETVMANLPLRILCKEDCKGLCPKCGKDLNTGECGCQTKEIDPRLAGLADFFKD